MQIRILAIHLRATDGVGLQLVYWVRMLQEAGHTVAVYVESIGPDVAPDVLAVTTQVDGLTFPHSDHWSDVEHSDVVICDYPAYFALAESVRLLTGPAILWLYHGVTPPEHWLDDDGRRYLAMSRHRAGLVHFAHLATTRSDWTRDELHRLTGFPRERVVIVPCVVDEPLNPIVHLPTPTPYILHVGRVAAHKRPELLVEALAVVRQSLPGAQLVLAGDARGPSHAPVVERVRERADALGVAHAVHCTGSLQPALLDHVYSRAAVSVSASAHEGFCIPVIEAMAHGVPVVVTDTAALPQTVSDAGIVVPDHDIPAFAAAIVRAIADRDERARLIERGLHHARAYRTDVVGAQLAALVEQTRAYPNHNRPRPRLRQLVDMSRLHAAAEVAPSTPATRRGIISRGAAVVRRWLQSDIHQQLDELTRRQVAYNRQVAQTLHAMDEWTADLGEQHAAMQRDHRP